jgi:acyl carrier protein
VTLTEIQNAVLTSLESVAPEIDARALDPEASLRDNLDIDSMDFLNFINAIHQKLQIEIPEADYQRVDTLANMIGYLAERLEV